MKAQPTGSPNNPIAYHANISAASLPVLAEQPSVHNGHFYFPEGVPLGKVKSRPDHASIISNKSSILSKRGKHTWILRARQFFNIGKNGRRGAMKWEDFLKVMCDMGFECGPSADGSLAAVTFNPPDKKDKPITFHKPPDSTLYPKKIREFRKQLVDYYEGIEEEFSRRVAAESES